MDLTSTMDELQLTGKNLGRVFNYRGGHVYAMHSCGYKSKLPNLKLKTRPKQLLVSIPLDIEPPAPIDWIAYWSGWEGIGKYLIAPKILF